MADIFSLIETTNAYKTIVCDKKNNKFSHAYLVLSADSEYLGEYLKIFAKVIACKSDPFCDNCRTCKLIDQKSSYDIIWYPKIGETVTVDDIEDLIEKSFLKPVESNIKIFIIEKGDSMTPQAQNKLLKTLEEPPKNTYFLVGAKNEFSLLPTVKSRIKRLEIPTFSGEKLYNAFYSELQDEQRLKRAISCGDGTAGAVKRFYLDENLENIENFCIDLINNMQSSVQVLDYSVRLDELLDDIVKSYKDSTKKISVDAKKSAESTKRLYLSYATEEFLSVIESIFRDMLCYFYESTNQIFDMDRIEKVKKAKGYTAGGLVYAIDRISEARKRKFYNTVGTMLNEWLLFSILEGKHKWQK